MPRFKTSALVGSLLLIGSFADLPEAHADVAPPAEHIDSCASSGTGAGRECLECAARETGCERKARAEGFAKECSGWGYTKYCRSALCLASSAPAQRSDCVLVDLKWPRHARASLPLHEEVCRSYRDEGFALEKLFARRLLCLKTNAQVSDAGSDSSQGCQRPLRSDCEQKCQQGDGASCAALGDMYKQGQGVLPADTRAAEYFEKACAAKVAEACLTASELYAKGSGSDPGTPERLIPNPHKAASLLAKACEAGIDRACQAVKAAPVIPSASEQPPPVAPPPLPDASLTAAPSPTASSPPTDNRPPPVAPGGCGRCSVSSLPWTAGFGLVWAGFWVALACLRRKARTPE